MRRTIVFGVSVLGALLVSAGLLASLQPFSSADAKPGSQASALDSLAKEFAQGSKVTVQSDGRMSFDGRLTPEASTVSNRLNDMAEAGPGSVTCSGDGPALTCTPMPDAEVLPALKRKETVYGRTAYSGVSEAAAKGQPMFQPDELVCAAFNAGKVALCRAVSETPPAVARGQDYLATYKKFEVTFRADGSTVGAMLGPPEIAPTISSN